MLIFDVLHLVKYMTNIYLSEEAGSNDFIIFYKQNSKIINGNFCCKKLLMKSSWSKIFANFIINWQDSWLIEFHNCFLQLFEEIDSFLQLFANFFLWSYNEKKIFFQQLFDKFLVWLVEEIFIFSSAHFYFYPTWFD